MRYCKTLIKTFILRLFERKKKKEYLYYTKPYYTGFHGIVSLYRLEGPFESKLEMVMHKRAITLPGGKIEEYPKLLMFEKSPWESFIDEHTRVVSLDNPDGYNKMFRRHGDMFIELEN